MNKRYTTTAEIRAALWDGKSHHGERVRVSIGGLVIEDCKLFDCMESDEWKDGKVLRYYFCQNEKGYCYEFSDDKFGYDYSLVFFDYDTNNGVDWFEFVEETNSCGVEEPKENNQIGFSKFDQAIEDLAIATANFVENIEATKKSIDEIRNYLTK